MPVPTLSPVVIDTGFLGGAAGELPQPLLSRPPPAGPPVMMATSTGAPAPMAPPSGPLVTLPLPAESPVSASAPGTEHIVRRRSRRPRAAIAAVVVLLAASGAAAALLRAASGPKVTLSGIVDLYAQSASSSGYDDNGFVETPQPGDVFTSGIGTRCNGNAAAGFGAVVEGGEVEVRSGSGKLLATGQLAMGAELSDENSPPRWFCGLSFEIPRVPRESSYKLMVAGSTTSWPLSRIHSIGIELNN